MLLTRLWLTSNFHIPRIRNWTVNDTSLVKKEAKKLCSYRVGNFFLRPKGHQKKEMIMREMALMAAASKSGP